MLSANDKITMRQLQILIILSAMGTGVIVLPRRVAELTGMDGWIIAIFLTVLSMVLGALISSAVNAMAKTKKNAGFVQSAGVLLTRPVAYICAIVLWFKIILAAGLELKVFLTITQQILLPRTPILVVSAVMLAVCGYAAAKGIETRARVAEVLLYLMVVPFIFLLIVALFSTNFSNLQPMLTSSPNALVNGTLRLGFIFTGLEVLLLVAPFITKHKNMGRAVVGALAFAGVIITSITIITLAKFGEGVVTHPFPVLSMMDMLDLPGSFIERQETLMFSFWIITCFVFINAMLFFGGVLVKDVLHLKYANKLTIGVILTSVAIFSVTAFPWETDAIYRRLDFLYMTTGPFFLIILPLLLLMSEKINKWAHNLNKKTAKGMSITLVLLLTSLTLTGCWDKVEIENRSFVVAMAIDKGEEDEKEDETFVVSLNMPLIEKDNEESDKKVYVKTAKGKTLSDALKNLDEKTNKNLYYNQCKLIIISDKVLNDKQMLTNTIETLNNKREVDRRINIVASSGSALDILNITPPEEPLSGLYISGICNRKNKTSIEFEELHTLLMFSDYAEIPVIYKDKNDEDAISFLSYKTIKALQQPALFP